MSLSLLIRSLRNGGALIGLLSVLSVVFLAVLGPLLAPHSPTAMQTVPYAPPGPGLPFGADSLGRDVWSRFLYGAASLVWMSFTASTIAVALGAAIGVSGAYWRGTTDEILMRIVDIKMAFPTTVFALLFVTMFGVSKLLLVVVVGVSLSPGVARVIRGAAMSIVQSEFIHYAQAAGFSTFSILRREIIPNVASLLLAEFGLRLMWAIAAIAGLSFLGFGIRPPNADWGLMINENRIALTIQVWAVILPIIGIAIFTIGGNLFAEGVARELGRDKGTDN